MISNSKRPLEVHFVTKKAIESIGRNMLRTKKKELFAFRLMFGKIFPQNIENIRTTCVLIHIHKKTHTHTHKYYVCVCVCV